MKSVCLAAVSSARTIGLRADDSGRSCTTRMSATSSLRVSDVYRLRTSTVSNRSLACNRAAMSSSVSGPIPSPVVTPASWIISASGIEWLP